MAEFTVGDILEYFIPGGGETLAVVVDKADSASGTIRTFAANPADDIPIGPTGEWTSDPFTVQINDTGSPGTATQSVASRLPREIRDRLHQWQMTPNNFQNTFWNVVTIGGIPQPHRQHITTLLPERATWVVDTSKTFFTKIYCQVKHAPASSMTIEAYFVDNQNARGPNADFADTLIPQMVKTSANIGTWQNIEIDVGTATYPGFVKGRTWALRVVSGPAGTGGGLPWEMREPAGDAGPITV